MKQQKLLQSLISASLILLFLVGCSAPATPTPTPVPLTATPTSIPPTLTPVPPTETLTPVPPTATTELPLLTDGTVVYRLISVSVENSIATRSYGDLVPKTGISLLRTDFKCDTPENPLSFALGFDAGNITSFNPMIYDEVYVTDSAGEKYHALFIEVQFDQDQKPASFWMAFGIVKGSQGFTLYFVDFPPIVLGS